MQSQQDSVTCSPTHDRLQSSDHSRSPLGREKMRECVKVSSKPLQRGEKAVQMAREMEERNRAMRKILHMDEWTPKLDTGNST